MSVATGTAIALAVTAGASAAGSIYAANRGGRSADRAMQLQTDAANTSAQLGAQTSQAQLDYLRQQDAQQRQDYMAELAYTRQRDDALTAYTQQQQAEAIARREPFRQFSLGALAQLQRPLNQRRPDGSLPAPTGTIADVVR